MSFLSDLLARFHRRTRATATDARAATDAPAPVVTEPPDARPTRARTALSVAVLAVLYLWVFPYHAQVNNPNENVRFFMTVAMVDDGTFAINRVERDWAYTNDKAVRATPLPEIVRRRISPDFLRGLVPDDVLARVRTGRLLPRDNAITVPLLYSSKAPGTSYLGVPAYWLLTRITGHDSVHRLSPPVAAHFRVVAVYWVRLFGNVLPALLFAWFWHRFLGRHTRVPALREAVFFSTMAGSLLFAYSEVFASHAQNAYCAMGALMALATARERDRDERAGAGPRRWSLVQYGVAGMLGVAVTMFEYPAALASAVVALLIVASVSERRVWGAFAAMPFVLFALKMYLGGHKRVAVALMAVAVGLYALTLTPRSLARLAVAGVGAAPPMFLTLLYHQRAFGAWSKTGYSFLENQQFHSEISQGFFGATRFSWESGVRMWFDPAFGLVPMTAIFLAAVVGFGSYFSVKVPRRAVWYVRGALGLLALFCSYKAVSAIGAIADAHWIGAATERAAWLAYAALAVIALAAVCVPKPVRPDAALGAAMLLICYSLTRLIGMMNNWRGGWQVGPRYLATLAPVLGFAALIGLDAIARGSVARRRAVTVFAAGATVQALLVSGVASAYFPHIPTEFTSPFFELFLPVLRAGLVPHNAGGHYLGWAGVRGMIPFFVAATVAAAIVLRGDEKRPLGRLAHALGGVAVALVLLVPIAAAAKYESMGVTRFVRGVWEPQLPPVSVRPPAHPERESRDAAMARGRALAEAGDANGALEAFRHAAQQAR